MLVDIGDADLVKTWARELRAGWVKEDPLAALRWTETHAPKEWDASWRMALFHPWAREDPVAAAAHLPEIADADERAWATHYVIDATFQTISKNDGEALRRHLPRIERLYATLPSEARSKHVAYFLYRLPPLRAHRPAAGCPLPSRGRRRPRRPVELLRHLRHAAQEEGRGVARVAGRTAPTTAERQAAGRCASRRSRWSGRRPFRASTRRTG